ncbi:RICIN domain-containing protein [Spirillospora sp. NPDC052269]
MATTQDAALAAARKTGKPVQVSSLLTSQWEVNALPNGQMEPVLNAKPSQQWTLREVSDGDYKLVNVNSGKCADVGADGDGAEVWQWGCYDAVGQLWNIVKQDNGVDIVSKRSGKCVEVWESSTGDGARVLQWTCSGDAAQRWKLTSVNTAVLGGTDHTLGVEARTGSTALKLNSDGDANTVGYAETALR